MSIADHQLVNAVTARYVRGALNPSPSLSDISHPLRLPVAPGAPGLVDYSELHLRLPLELGRVPVALARMLQPLVEISERHLSDHPAGQWTYDWFYLELLDMDGDAQAEEGPFGQWLEDEHWPRPICWIASEVLFSGQVDDRPREAGQSADAHTLGESRRMLSQMDTIAQTESGRDAQHEEWRQWLVRTWRANEEQWLKQGLLTYEPMRPWLSQLRYDPALAESLVPTRWGGEDRKAPLWRYWSRAGNLGLYWNMVPIYDQRSVSLIWIAMQYELYQTSVFNPEATARQDPDTWRRIERRFFLEYRRMTERQLAISERERRVLEWSKEGKTLGEMADLLMETGLYPLLGETWGTPTKKSARRVVVRIRERLHQDGLVDRRPSGRRKQRPD